MKKISNKTMNLMKKYERLHDDFDEVFVKSSTLIGRKEVSESEEALIIESMKCFLELVPYYSDDASKILKELYDGLTSDRLE